MQIPGVTGEKGIIAWFAANHVAANLLMLFIIVAGLLSVSSITKETQPEFQLNWVQIRVPYLGAAPQWHGCFYDHARQDAQLQHNRYDKTCPNHCLAHTAAPFCCFT